MLEQGTEEIYRSRFDDEEPSDELVSSLAIRVLEMAEQVLFKDMDFSYHNKPIHLSYLVDTSQVKIDKKHVRSISMIDSSISDLGKLLNQLSEVLE